MVKKQLPKATSYAASPASVTSFPLLRKAPRPLTRVPGVGPRLIRDPSLLSQFRSLRPHKREMGANSATKSTPAELKSPRSLNQPLLVTHAVSSSRDYTAWTRPRPQKLNLRSEGAERYGKSTVRNPDFCNTLTNSSLRKSEEDKRHWLHLSPAPRTACNWFPDFQGPPLAFSPASDAEHWPLCLHPHVHWSG